MVVIVDAKKTKVSTPWHEQDILKLQHICSPSAQDPQELVWCLKSVECDNGKQNLELATEYEAKRRAECAEKRK